MTEQQRIETLKNKGGCYLKNYAESSRTYALCLAAVKLDGRAIQYVPEKHRTEKMYIAACKTSGWIIREIPGERLSEEIVKSAVSSFGAAVYDIPDKFKTREVYLLAAKKDPEVLKDTPADFIDVDFCIAVVKSNDDSVISLLPKEIRTNSFYFDLAKAMPNLIWVIPKAAHTAELCKTVISGMGYQSIEEAVKKKPALLSQLHTSLYDHDACLAFVKSKYFRNAVSKSPFTTNKFYGFNTDSDYEKGRLYLYDEYTHTYSLKHILRWPDVCKIAVEIFPDSIRYIDEKLLTSELCLKAVSKLPALLDDIPLRFRTKDVCLKAFENDPILHCITSFPEEYQTSELWLAVVQKDGYMIQYMPERLMNREIAIAAVSSCNYSLKYIKEEYLDEEICMTAIQELDGYSVGILEYVPEKYRTYEICLASVKKDGYCFKYVPEKHRTYELCLAAAEKASRLDGIPDEYYTEELCLKLIGDSDPGFKTIPKSHLTEKICLEAIRHGSQSGTVLADVPDELITQEMCDLSVQISIRSFRDVPDRYVTEPMLLHVAETAPGLLPGNFPDRFKKKEIYDKLIEKNPAAEFYIQYMLDRGSKPSS